MQDMKSAFTIPEFYNMGQDGKHEPVILFLFTDLMGNNFQHLALFRKG